GAAMAESFPRRHAVTRRFTLGAPRSVTVSADGSRVWFLRSGGSEDPLHAVWVFDVATGEERAVVDPATIGADESDLPEAELARRERARESAEGVVTYATDRDGRRAAMALGGQVVLADAGTGEVQVLEAAPGAFDPRPDPSGERVAYVAEGALRVVAPGEADRVIVAEDGVTWELAEFIAAEEFSRTRGFWWAPDGSALLAERVDESPVAEWHIASPAEPWRPPRAIRYPAAGTANAACSLAIVGLDGTRVDVGWDTDTFPYLLTATWPADAPLTISVLTRDQRTMSVQTVDPATGVCTEVLRHTDAAWVEPVGGTPAWHGGRLVTVADDLDADTRRVHVDGVALSPAGVQVRSVVDVGDDGLVVTCTLDDPTETHVARVGWDGSVDQLTTGRGVHGAAVGGGTIVV